MNMNPSSSGRREEKADDLIIKWSYWYSESVKLLLKEVWLLRMHNISIWNIVLTSLINGPYTSIMIYITPTRFCMKLPGSYPCFFIINSQIGEKPVTFLKTQNMKWHNQILSEKNQSLNARSNERCFSEKFMCFEKGWTYGCGWVHLEA